MAIEAYINPPQLILEALFVDFEGKPKENVVSATVRVFHITGAVEVSDLPPTALTRVGSSATWRFVWNSPPLPSPGAFIIDYSNLDTDNIAGSGAEDLLLFDPDADDVSVLAALTTLTAMVNTQSGDITKVLDTQLGRWKLDVATKTLTVYTQLGAVLKVFDLKDDLNNPSVLDVFDRQPRP